MYLSLIHIYSSDKDVTVTTEELAEPISEDTPVVTAVLSEQEEDDNIQIAMEEETACSEAPPPELQQIQTELNNELDVEIPYAFRNRRDQQEADERAEQKRFVSWQEVDKTEQTVPSVKLEAFSSEEPVAVVNEKIQKETPNTKPVIKEETKEVNIDCLLYTSRCV